MFDHFNPLSLLCPRCGHPLIDFQGKPAQPLQYVWQENERHPVDQRCDAEWRSPRIHTATLDENVGIYGSCTACGYDIRAEAVVRDKLWCDTRFAGTVHAALSIEDLYFICGNCNYCFDRLHAGTVHLCPDCHEPNHTISPPSPPGLLAIPPTIAGR